MEILRRKFAASAFALCVLALSTLLLTACGAAADEPPPATPTLLSGWNMHNLNKDGFGLALPSNWEEWDLNTVDLKGAFSDMRATNPQLASALSSQVANLAVQGVKFFAIDQDAISDGDTFATNVNVIKQSSMLLSPDLDSVTQQSLTELRTQFKSALSTDVNMQKITINGRPARRLDYDLELNMPNGDAMPMSVVQFVAVRDKSIYIVTCTTTSEQFGYYVSTFDNIGKSLWLFEPSE